MWSLPDIHRLNEVAEREAPKYLKAAKTKRLNRKKIRCESCEELATLVEPYYDIFSDKPKGLVALCDQHQGELYEQYFQCEHCDRLMINNYTWEVYYRDDPYRGRICLTCAAELHFANDLNWIHLSADDIFVDLFGLGQVDWEWVRSLPHVLGVKQPVPKGYRFYRNVEFDSFSTGGRLTGTHTCESGPEGGVGEIVAHLSDLKADGVQRALVILDACYQFSVSVGIYVDDDAPIKEKNDESE